MTFPGLELGLDEWAQGVMDYADHIPSELEIKRIVIKIRIEGSFASTMAMVDTGSNYLTLHPAEAEDFKIEFADVSIEKRIGGGKWTGKLGRVWIELLATKGNSIRVQATVWVPDDPHDIWNHPNLIGYAGVLENIRFAVDSQNNRFYFGGSPDDAF